MGLKNDPKERDNTIFASVLADGKIHVAVAEGTEGAIEREYEISDGKTGKKHEMIYTELSGIITAVKFDEGDYGINLQIVVADEDAAEDEKPVTLSLPINSNYGEDMMKKLPNLNLKKPVVLSPYSFEDKGKKKRGVSVKQDGEKIDSFYYDADKKKIINGYPEAPTPKGGKAVTKVQWRKYFEGAAEFLMADLIEREIATEGEESEADKTYKKM